MIDFLCTHITEEFFLYSIQMYYNRLLKRYICFSLPNVIFRYVCVLVDGGGSKGMGVQKGWGVGGSFPWRKRRKKNITYVNLWKADEIPDIAV